MIGTSSTFLAIDTSTQMLSLALRYRDHIFVVHEHVGQKHSEAFLPKLEELRQQAACPKECFTRIIYNAGPGAFTGIRMACTFAQGLAYARKGQVWPVLSLDVLAWRYWRRVLLTEQPLSSSCCVVIDARMRQYYQAIYTLSPTAPPTRTAGPELVGRNTLSRADTGIPAPEEVARDIPPDFWPQTPHAELLLGYVLAHRNIPQWRPPLEADIFYVRDKVTETTEERQQLRRKP